MDCMALKEVELHDDYAFSICRALREVHVSDGVESNTDFAFAYCNFIKFRCPPLITTIPHGMLYDCRRMFSLELPENIIQVGDSAMDYCYSLQNFALAPNALVAQNAFSGCRDPLLSVNTEEAIVNALQNQFSRLLLH